MNRIPDDACSCPEDSIYILVNGIAVHIEVVEGGFTRLTCSHLTTELGYIDIEPGTWPMIKKKSVRNMCSHFYDIYLEITGKSDTGFPDRRKHYFQRLTSMSI